MSENPEERSLRGNHDEEEIEDGLGVHIGKKTLFHGSGIRKISEFTHAEETTVGSGVYLTSKLDTAQEYGRKRVEKNSTGAIYETRIENIRLLDLRNDENVYTILQGFLPVIEQKLLEENLAWHFGENLRRAQNKIYNKEVRAGNLKDVLFHMGELFSKYVASLGYDGLVAIEGGEGADMGIHDTYLIFDPKKVKIIKEQTIE